MATTLPVQNLSRLIDQYPCLYKYLSGLNLTEAILNPEKERLCVTHVTIYNYINFIFLHVNPILLLVLIFISFYGKIKENYRWIIIHSSLLNFAIIALFIYGYWKPKKPSTKYGRAVNEVKQVSNFIIYVILLAAASMLPLTINRFCFLYHPTFYQKVFRKFRLILFILGYDIFICLYYLTAGILGLKFMVAIAKFAVMFLHLTLSILLIRKIQSMQKLAYTPTFKKITIADLYRISILCSLQATFYIIFMFLTFVTDLLYNFYYVNLYLNIYIYLGVFYQLMICVDTTLLLFLLKSYRVALIGASEIRETKALINEIQEQDPWYKTTWEWIKARFHELVKTVKNILGIQESEQEKATMTKNKVAEDRRTTLNPITSTRPPQNSWEFYELSSVNQDDIDPYDPYNHEHPTRSEDSTLDDKNVDQKPQVYEEGHLYVAPDANKPGLELNYYKISNNFNGQNSKGQEVVELVIYELEESEIDDITNFSTKSGPVKIFFIIGFIILMILMVFG